MADKRNRSKRLIDRMRSEGFDLVDPVRSVTAKATPVKTQCEASLEKRLANWSDTVRGNVGGGRGGACASWASAYVAARNDREKQLAIALRIVKPESTLYAVGVDELDGWLIEAIVRSMVYFDQMQALRHRYVWNYSNHWIKTKLKINDTSLRIVMARALTNLQMALDKLESPARIRSNNSHAGIVPSPEASVAVPVGTAAPLK